jgi:pimeloyl-ACP methyl ester carboxylesterase
MIKSKLRALCGAVAITLLVAAVVGAAQPQPLTPRSVVAKLDSLKLSYEVPNFRIGGKYDLARPDAWSNGGEGGQTLESLGAKPARTAYIAVGTPRRNAKGEIINAIVINAYYSGDATAMYNNWIPGQAGNSFSGGALVGPGLLFDTNRFYVVFVDALGLWGASKPSDGLGRKFPVYSYYDVVHLNYRLLRDHLKVGKVVLATGVSMGATQAYYWGLMYPGFVEAVMPVGGATATDGEGPMAAWTFQLAKAALESDPVWIETKGNYYQLPKEKHPNKGVEYHWSVLSLTGYELGYRQSLGWGTVSKEVFSWEPDPRMGKDAGANLGNLAKIFDGVDLWYRDTVGEIHNIDALLPGMKARTLVVHVENDQWLISDEARQSARDIPGGQYVSLTSPIAHYAVFSALNTLRDNPILGSFVRDIGLVGDKTKVCTAKDYRSPHINMKPDPAKSFWKDEMISPFPVKYAKVKDRRGIEWEIGYMDEYCGKEKNPPVLVVVHGKGAFAADYGYLIKYAVERGYRVIAPDMPQWGTSGPGNLDKPFTRTLDEVRDAFHALIIGKLGVKKAFYHGHSLGGSVVLGYALRYPEAVRGLILEAPAGLEEYPKNIKFDDKELPLCDKSFAYDRKRWEEVYGQTGMVEAERKRTAQDVRDFFYFKQRDKKTGVVTPSYNGYFKNDTEYARLHTDQRIAMISGNPLEFDQWTFMFIYDLYSICSENTIDDPNSLDKQLTKIKVPIFLAFGAQEPFIPGTALNGLKDLAKDIINPFMKRMTAAGNRPALKVYPGVAHFIHTDVPYEFSRDAVDFMRAGRVEALSPEVVDTLINGVKVTGTSEAAVSKPTGLAK